MRLKDKYGIEYRTAKQKGDYYLISVVLNSETKKYRVRTEVKGKENIFKFIKNNKLEVIKNES